MRRVATAVALLAALAVGAGLLASGSSADRGDYRVAAIFDTAKGMVAGQQVKIAGAVVGRVESIGLAPGPKARMELKVERRFAPFRADATCSIRPEGLISENFVECSPGTAASSSAADHTGTPVVPLEHTTTPVSLQDVIDVFALPTAQRLRVLVSELGIAGAGRGEDFNELLRRANPALTSSRRVLDILEAQRDQISDAVAQTDRVLGRLGDEDKDVRTFVDRAADVAATTASKRVELGAAVQRLPGMLRAVRPGLRSLDSAARDTTPLLRSLRTAGPGLTELTRTLPEFSEAGRPALRALTAVARTGRPAIKRATPVMQKLSTSTRRLGVLAPEVDKFLVSLRDSGGIEGAMRITYTLAVLASAYDETSHLINFIANVAPNCIIAEQANVDSPGCSRMWNAPGDGTVPINQPKCGAQRPENMWRNYRCPYAPAPVGTTPPPSKGGKSPARRPALGKPLLKPDATSPAPAKPGRIPAIPLDVPKILEGILGNGGTDGRPLDNDATTALLDFLLR